MAINKIYPFAQTAVPPNILNDADYAASSTTTNGYQAGSIEYSTYSSKAQRQTSAMSAGLAQWIADNQVTDVTDALLPATLAAMITAALSAVNFTTQPQFDNTQKAATTEFVKRAIGSFSKIESYGVNSALPITTAGNLVIPTSAGVGLTLPLSSTVDYGSIIEFNGNGHGLVISRTGSDVINNGLAGALSSISLLEQDSVTLVAVFGGWSVIDGEGHQAVSSSFAYQHATNGFQKLPGGLVLQWGLAVTTLPTPVIVAFPIPFTSQCYQVTGSDQGAPTFNDCYLIGTSNITTTSFSVVSRATVSGATVSGTPVSWFAIGK